MSSKAIFRPIDRLALPVLGVFLLLGSSLACSFITTRFPALSVVGRGLSSSGLIAYVGSDGNIYSTDRDGSQVRQITHRTEDSSLIYQYPTWAPDGSRLSFSSLERGSGVRQIARIYTVDPDGKDLVDVFRSDEQQPFYFYWSPDSQSISFLSSFSSGQGLILQVVPARGGNPRALGIGQPFYWDWAPDSRTVSIHTGGAAADSDEARLALLTLGENLHEEELPLRPTAFQAPAWSPDGEALLLAAETGAGGAALLLLGQDGTVERQIESVDGPVAFAWSPDGSRLAYLQSQPDGQNTILRSLSLLDLSDVSQPLTIAESGVAAFFWAPDSRQVAYFIPQFSESIPQEQGVSFSAPHSLPAQVEPELRLSLMIYDVHTGQSRQTALFKPADDFLNLLPFFDQYARSATLWSPDSRHLVVAGLDSSGSPGIYRVDAAGEQPPERIADGTLAFWSWK